MKVSTDRLSTYSEMKYNTDGFSVKASIDEWIKRLQELKEKYGGETPIEITILEEFSIF